MNDIARIESFAKIAIAFGIAGAWLAPTAANAADAAIPAYQIDQPIPAYANQLPPAAYKTQVTPAYDWTGPYVGINIGGQFGNSTWASSLPIAPTDISVSGGAVGASLGYNLEFRQWVVGVDADIDWMNTRGSTPCLFGICETRSSWLGTTRARLGYAFDRIWPYATAGLSFGQLSASTTAPPFSISSTKFGLAVGAGVEYAIFGPWTGKAEYLFVDLSKLDCPLCSRSGPVTVDYKLQAFRLGLNYRY